MCRQEVGGLVGCDEQLVKRDRWGFSWGSGWAERQMEGYRFGMESLRIGCCEVTGWTSKVGGQEEGGLSMCVNGHWGKIAKGSRVVGWPFGRLGFACYGVELWRFMMGWWTDGSIGNWVGQHCGGRYWSDTSGLESVIHPMSVEIIQILLQQLSVDKCLLTLLARQIYVTINS